MIAPASRFQRASARLVISFSSIGVSMAIGRAGDDARASGRRAAGRNRIDAADARAAIGMLACTRASIITASESAPTPDRPALMIAAAQLIRHLDAIATRRARASKNNIYRCSLDRHRAMAAIALSDIGGIIGRAGRFASRAHLEQHCSRHLSHGDARPALRVAGRPANIGQFLPSA